MNNSSQDIFRVSCEIFGSSYSFKSELPSEKLLIVYIIVLVFNAILIIPTILLNVVSIITILKSSHLSSKPCYFVILVQSVIDSAVGFFGIPSFLVYTLGKIGLHSNCGVLLLGYLTTIVMVNISMIVLLAMTLERYIAVLHHDRDKKANPDVCMHCLSLVLLRCHSITNFPQINSWMGNSTINHIFFLHRTCLHKNILGRKKVNSFPKQNTG